jgi:hypothetical protein
MRVVREMDGSVIIRERWTVLRLAALAGAAAIPVLLAMDSGATTTGRTWIGGLVAAGLLAVVAAAVVDLEYRFDPRARLVSWRRARLFGRRTGSVAYADIRDVLVRAETERDEDAHRSRTVWRLELVTSDGTLSLTNQRALRPDEHEVVADLLRTVIGLPAPHPEEGVARLARAGYLVDAVALARRQLGCTLDDASALVDRLRREPPDQPKERGSR